MARLRQRVGELGQILLKNHLTGQNQAEEQARAFQQQDKIRMAALSDKLSEAAQDPSKYDSIAQIAQGLGVKLAASRPTDLQVTQPTRESIQKEQNPEALPDQGELEQNLEAKFPQRPQLYQKEGVLPPSMGEGPSNAPSPTIQDLLAQTEKQKADIKAHLAGLVTQAGAMSKAQEYNKEAGKNQATGEDFPNALARKSDEEWTAVGPAVEKANEIAQGAEDVQNDPSNVKGAANRAGAISGAQENAKTPAMLMRERVMEQERQKNRIELEQLKLKEPTTQTRAMMEGARMMTPHIESIKQQAEALDKAGLFGPFMSRVRELAAKAGTIDEFEGAMAQEGGQSKDKAIGRFATELGLTASGIARVHGGARGGGNAMMLGYMKNLLSDAGSLPMFEGRMDGAQEFMTGYANGPNNIQPLSPPSPVGNPTIPLTPKLQNRIGG